MDAMDPGRAVAQKARMQFRPLRMLRNYGRPRLPSPDRTKTKEDHRRE